MRKQNCFIINIKIYSYTKDGSLKIKSTRFNRVSGEIVGYREFSDDIGRGGKHKCIRIQTPSALFDFTSTKLIN